MAAPRPSNQLARHAIDELMEFSGETQVPKYMKFFIKQQIAETSNFINVMREQAQLSRNRLAQLNVMILEMEAMNDPEKFYDALFCLRDDKRDEYNTLMAINYVIAEAEEKLTTKEEHLEIMKAEINLV
ncbi:hypothetical protein Tco_0646252 [Tanacetum coccineum]